MTRSAIYTGTVRHRRFSVRRKQFTHGVAMAYIDLDEMPRLLGGRLVSPRPGLVRLRRSDYLGPADVPLDEAVRARVAESTGHRPAGPVRMLTHLRTFGHCFNPVTIYYCFDPDERLQALVAEVTSTPWGERRAYVISRDGPGLILRGEQAKMMHVSPFMGMDQRYVWNAGTPGETLSVHIENREGDQRVFDATLALHHEPFTRKALARATARYPAATVRMLALIYAHAAVAWLRGIPIHPHPAAGGTAS
jgi:uncharacterized protein